VRPIPEPTRWHFGASTGGTHATYPRSTPKGVLTEARTYRLSGGVRAEKDDAAGRLLTPGVRHGTIDTP
jgi:hypothetical protein